MEISIPGAIVGLGLWVLGYALGAPLILGLFGSFAFGATAIASFGGITVPLFGAFGLALVVTIAMRRTVNSELADVLVRQPVSLFTCALILYALVTAFLFPRLFADNATVINPWGQQARLGPVPGNLNQASYFLLNGLIFLATAVLLRRGLDAQIRRGFFVFASIHTFLGFIDAVSRTIGWGDIFAPIRTASYVMMTNCDVGGFQRIVGGFPEASAYAVAALQALAFTFVDWRTTHSSLSLTLAGVLFFLVIFSTSSTGYAGLAILVVCFCIATLSSVLRGRILGYDIFLLLLLWVGIGASLGIYLYDERIFRTFTDMIGSATFNKLATESGIERSTWNQIAVAGIFDTYGMGLGLGSSRSSSWPISVLSQFGFIGAVGFVVASGVLLVAILRVEKWGIDALPASASACALAGVVAASFGGSGADPGMIFFIALAIVSAKLKLPTSGRRANRDGLVERSSHN